MGLFDSYSFFEAVEYDLSADTHNLPINSNKIVVVPSADIKLTGIKKPELIVGEIALFFIRNGGNFNVTLSAKDVLSLEQHQFHMDNDIVLKNGEVAVFLINDEGLFSYGVLLSDNKHYYTVRNAAIVDVDAADKVVYDSEPIFGSSGSIAPLGFNYKVLQYSTPHTFEGTETWVEEMTTREVLLNAKNPLYFDLSGEDAYEIGYAIKEALYYNQKLSTAIISEAAGGHLVKNALVWTSPQKVAFNTYWNKIRFIALMGNIGAMRVQLLADKALLDAAAPVTVTDPYTGTVYTPTVLTSAMLQYAIDKCNIQKKKFPDGTI